MRVSASPQLSALQLMMPEEGLRNKGKDLVSMWNDERVIKEQNISVPATS